MKTLNSHLEELLSINAIHILPHQVEKLINYVLLLLDFNKNINLISRKDEKNIVERHIIPCLKFSTLFNGFEQDALDIGTGGGLPGVIFAITNPKCRITLTDSIQKKIKALEAIVQSIGLDNVYPVWTRVENKEFIQKNAKKFDLIISRATASLKTLVEYASPLVKNEHSILATMKGGDELDLEIMEAKKRFNYIAIKKLPLIYLPENPDNINKKFIIIVERMDGRK